MKTLRISGNVLFALSAMVIGAYPMMYFVSDVLVKYGLLSQKAEAVKAMDIWQWMFYAHIIFGGMALLIGWIQFFPKFRSRYLKSHRIIGMIYLTAISLSGVAGLFLAFYAEGGWVAKTGFGALALAWLVTSTKALTSIKKGQVNQHRNWMIRSYALTFAAVTLRIYLPLFQFALGMEFFTAYVIIAWLCWVPNLAWAEWRIKRLVS